MAVGSKPRAGPGKRPAGTSARKAAGVAEPQPDPRHNHLLAALPAGDYDRIAAHLELVPMKLGDILYEPGARMRYVYFPTTSIVSLLYGMENGAAKEIAIVGNY